MDHFQILLLIVIPIRLKDIGSASAASPKVRFLHAFHDSEHAILCAAEKAADVVDVYGIGRTDVEVVGDFSLNNIFINILRILQNRSGILNQLRLFA